MTQEVRQAAVRDATTIVSALIQAGNYKSLTEQEIMQAVLYLADKIIVPYTVNGMIVGVDSPGGQEEIDNGAPF